MCHSCLKVVSKIFQSFIKVVTKLFHSCPTVVLGYLAWMVRQTWSSWRASLKRSCKMQFRRVDLSLIGPPNQVMTKSNFGPISRLSLQCKTPKWRQELIYGSIMLKLYCGIFNLSLPDGDEKSFFGPTYF